MLPQGHPRQFLALIKSRKRPAPDMGPTLGQIKQAEEISMKLARFRIRHFLDLQNTQARALGTMSAAKGNFRLATLRKLLERMR